MKKKEHKDEAEKPDAATLAQWNHQCSDAVCVCPLCHRRLWYAPSTGRHSCPDMACAWRDR